MNNREKEKHWYGSTNEYLSFLNCEVLWLSSWETIKFFHKWISELDGDFGYCLSSWSYGWCWSKSGWRTTEERNSGSSIGIVLWLTFDKISLQIIWIRWNINIVFNFCIDIYQVRNEEKARKMLGSDVDLVSFKWMYWNTLQMIKLSSNVLS